MRRFLWMAVISLGGVIVVGSPAAAHQTKESLHITEVRKESGEVEQLLSISAEDLTEHLGYGEHGVFPSPTLLELAREDVLHYLEAHTPVKADGEVCALEESDFVGYPGGDGRVHYHQLWRCPQASHEVTLTNWVLSDKRGGYRHMGRVQVGERITPTVYDGRFPEYKVYLDAGPEGEEGAVDEQDRGDEGDKNLWVLVVAVLVVIMVVGLSVLGRRDRS